MESNRDMVKLATDMADDTGDEFFRGDALYKAINDRIKI
jgi:hypothetical protein